MHLSMSKTLHIVPGLDDVANGMVVVAKLLAKEQGDAEVVDLKDSLRTLRPAGSCDRFAARPSASANLTTSSQAHLPMGREPPPGYPPVADRREAVARVVRLPPPYRFNCLLACSFHCQFPRFEI